MTFKNVTRGLALGAAVAGLSLTANAQNGSNYAAIGNGFDAIFAGGGAGPTQTPGDGIGHYIPGEDLRGATRDAIEGDFAVKQFNWRESACVLAFPAGSTTGTLQYATITWWEFLGTGTNNTGHTPVVFPNPNDAACGGFPLGGTAGFVPFGTPAGSSAAFAGVLLPSAIGSGTALVPNENLITVPSSAAASFILLAGAASGPATINSTGFCWSTQFNWVPSALASVQDSNNGWWHWVQTNPAGGQYWAFSNDEANLWKSRTIISDSGATALLAFGAEAEYNTTWTTRQPNTNLATSPAGTSGTGAYYVTTAGDNLFDGITGAPAFNFNGGYDLGGHGTLSLTGTNGVPNGASGLGNQDPLAVGGVAPAGGTLLPAIGFHTYDNTSGSGSEGGKKVVWISVDIDHAIGLSPVLAADVAVAGGTLRTPILSTASAPGIQGATLSLLSFFSHEVFDCPGCASGAPSGFGPNSFGVASTQGATQQIPIPPLSSVCSGLPLPLTYGSSGLKGTAGAGVAGGGITWDQTLSATSGVKTFFLFD